MHHTWFGERAPLRLPTYVDGGASSAGEVAVSTSSPVSALWDGESCKVHAAEPRAFPILGEG